MKYEERVKYYIEECHLDRYDAEREATEDSREELKQKADSECAKRAMIDILDNLRVIIDVISEKDLHALDKQFSRILEDIGILIDKW